MPVLMLHGSGGSKEVFSRQFESGLGEAYRLIAIDLPGHGASDDAADPAKIYSVRGLAAVAGAVIDALELDRPAVYGWSLGGHIAIQLAAERGDIAGTALTGCPPIGPGPLAALRGFHARWDMLLASKEEFTDRDAQRFMRLLYGASGNADFLKSIERSDGRLRKHFLRSLMGGEGVDQKRFVETSGVPVAMINGADDPTIRHSYIEHLNYAALWEAGCQSIAGAGHAPFWEQAESFNRVAHRFFKYVALERIAAGDRKGARQGGSVSTGR